MIAIEIPHRNVEVLFCKRKLLKNNKFILDKFQWGEKKRGRVIEILRTESSIAFIASNDNLKLVNIFNSSAREVVVVVGAVVAVAPAAVVVEVDDFEGVPLLDILLCFYVLYNNNVLRCEALAKIQLNIRCFK
jgi:hypothetical protein